LSIQLAQAVNQWSIPFVAQGHYCGKDLYNLNWTYFKHPKETHDSDTPVTDTAKQQKMPQNQL